MRMALSAPSVDAQLSPANDARLSRAAGAQLSPAFDAQFFPAPDAQLPPAFDAQFSPAADAQLPPAFDAQFALAVDAQEMAYSLVGDMRNRWRHTVGVAQRAAELAGPLGVDHDVLVAAAWLHDIGYADATRATGFHPLDGADYLAARDWPTHIAGLVAHHSGARFIAAARGLGERLAAYPDLGGLLSDALTYADQTVGPCGDRVTPHDRYTEMLLRHGPDSWNAKVDHHRRPHLQAVARRVEAHL